MNTKIKSLLIKVWIGFLSVALLTLLICFIVMQKKTIEKQELALLTIEMAFDNADYDSIETKYDFMDKRKAVYIEALCKQNKVDSDRAFAHLMQENSSFDEFAVNRDNTNGSVDLGLFMLNDKYLWTDFVPRYWVEGVEFDPFNWKHNTYIAIHHMAWLQEKLKVEDDIIMAYNCGLNTVINDRVPTSTKEDYLVKVKNNLNMLRNYKE